MRRRIPQEIKQEILAKVEADEQIQQYTVSTKTIYGWLRQDTGEGVVSVLQYNKLKRENEELKRLTGLSSTIKITACSPDTICNLSPNINI